MTPHPAKLAAVLVAALIAGCAQDGTLAVNNLNTASINPPDGSQQAAKPDALCRTLASQIAALNKDGIADKVSKAAVKKYKMKPADLAKADELNKANAEFQAKCSSYPPTATMAAATPAAKEASKATKAPVKTKVVKRNPPVPSQKPVTSALAQQPSAVAEQSPTTSQPAAQP